MKKIIALLVSIVMVIGGAGCNPSNHEHKFLAYRSEDPTCTTPGTIKYICATCFADKVEENAPALGHAMSEFVEASRITFCTREGCAHTQLAEGNGKYAETLAFTFNEEDKALLEAKHSALLAIFEGAEDYDPARHGLAEEGALAEEYAAAKALYDEYSDLIDETNAQRAIAETLYLCDHRNQEVEQRFNDIQAYYTDLVAKFYALSQPWYDSMFREFFFEGATEEEINEFLVGSNAYADEEFTALRNRNDEIELEFNGLADAGSDDKVPALYAEFVANNAQMAEILGYENYLEYAYADIYERDYTYQDAAQFIGYVKKYLVPIFNASCENWIKATNVFYSDATVDTYNSVVSNSFFEDVFANTLFNDYLDDMDMAFTSNADKTYSFSDAFNDLFTDGNLFRGTYESAYVDYIQDIELPIVYFGEGYDSTSTVAHEFGHYMNAIYNGDSYKQSFDLCETHSQGRKCFSSAI